MAFDIGTKRKEKSGILRFSVDDTIDLGYFFFKLLRGYPKFRSNFLAEKVDWFGKIETIVTQFGLLAEYNEIEICRDVLAKDSSFLDRRIRLR